MFKDHKKTGGWQGTLIGQGSNAEGKLECEANLRIEGSFHGEIHCQGQVVIGETGEAYSNINGADIVVAGKVIGDVTSQGRLTISSSGLVEGNVNVAKLVITEGGLLNGSSKMEKAAAATIPAAEPIKKSKKTAQPEAG
ncbi:bactofilin family protein [Paenibacillus bouchesdurhonensis]|uniref:bactofilin family protein n=1 Tax=Paenibacillus bouchesdurhonensis TaxID=1870990 RepID=UPI000DA62EDD|nr:polymer-forming cytoskeletal protein [Paenibacillus bouchesdurhonensis]